MQGKGRAEVRHTSAATWTAVARRETFDTYPVPGLAIRHTVTDFHHCSGKFVAEHDGTAHTGAGMCAKGNPSRAGVILMHICAANAIISNFYFYLTWARLRFGNIFNANIFAIILSDSQHASSSQKTILARLMVRLTNVNQNQSIKKHHFNGIVMLFSIKNHTICTFGLSLCFFATAEQIMSHGLM